MTLSKSNSNDGQSDLSSQLSGETLSKSSLYNSDSEMNPKHQENQKQSTSSSSEIKRITLLEEKLQASRRQQKVGEVIVRKQVETRIIKIPIRREKLIVERIGKNPEQLTEVIVGQEKVNGFDYEDFNNTDSLHMTKSNFIELGTAQNILNAITQLSSVANTKVRLEIVTNCSEHQITHQDICERFQ